MCEREREKDRDAQKSTSEMTQLLHNTKCYAQTFRPSVSITWYRKCVRDIFFVFVWVHIHSFSNLPIQAYFSDFASIIALNTLCGILCNLSPKRHRNCMIQTGHDALEILFQTKKKHFFEFLNNFAQVLIQQNFH